MSPKHQERIFMKPETLDIPDEKLREIFTWPIFLGFAGESCGLCHKTANVPGGGPGWFCENCGHMNITSLNHFPSPHNQPDMGPSRERIATAYKRRG